MLAKRIEHTLLRADAVRADFDVLVQEGLAHGFRGVCVPSCWIEFCKSQIGTAPLSLVAVVGFPLGNGLSASKGAETAGAIAAGADEIDVPVNRGFLRGGDHRAVESDLAVVVAAAEGRDVKVILETCELNREEMSVACKVALGVGAAFVKTSTGMGAGGATADDVAFLREQVGDKAGIKASGGIRTRRAAETLVAAGADRLGTSASIAIVSEPGE